VIRVISPIRPVRFDDLRAVAISLLVEWGTVVGGSILVAVCAVGTSILMVRGAVMGSSILVLVLAVATFSSIGWGKYSHGKGGLGGIAYGEG